MIRYSSSSLSPLLTSSLKQKLGFVNLCNSKFLANLFVRLLFLLFFVSIFYVLFFKLQNLHNDFLRQNRFRTLKEKMEFEVRFKNVRMPYRVRIPSTQCAQSTKLLVLIMTRRGAFNNRESIRKTWATDAVPGTVIRYLVGDPPKADKRNESILIGEHKELIKENEMNGDLIFLEGIEDSYANLHLKWYGALHWHLAFCANAEFVMKTDDDTVVHLPRLDHWMEHKFRPALRKNPATYFGWIISGKQPIREAGHKWFVSKSAYPEDSYPDYMQGATYLASNQAISAVMRHTHEVGGFNMDDVLFTGILAKIANVTLFDAGNHFRVGSALSANEKCVDEFPEAIALYGAGSLDQFNEIYEKLNAIECA